MKTEKLKKLMLRNTTQQDYRPKTSGIYHDPEEKLAIATNAIVMFASRSVYDETKAGKIINKKDEEVPTSFVVWRSVVPRSLGDYSEPIDLDEVFEKRVAVAKAYSKKYKEHHIGVRLGNSEVAVSPEVATEMLKYSRTGWRVNEVAPFRPIICETKDGFMLTMSVLMGDGNTTWDSIGVDFSYRATDEQIVELEKTFNEYGK